MIVNGQLFDRFSQTQAELAASIKMVGKFVGQLEGDKTEIAQIMSTLNCFAAVAEYQAADFDNLAFWAKEKGLFEEVPS